MVDWATKLPMGRDGWFFSLPGMLGTQPEAQKEVWQTEDSRPTSAVGEKQKLTGNAILQREALTH